MIYDFWGSVITIRSLLSNVQVTKIRAQNLDFYAGPISRSIEAKYENAWFFSVDSAIGQVRARLNILRMSTPLSAKYERVMQENRRIMRAMGETFEDFPHKGNRYNY